MLENLEVNSKLRWASIPVAFTLNSFVHSYCRTNVSIPLDLSAWCWQAPSFRYGGRARACSDWMTQSQYRIDRWARYDVEHIPCYRLGIWSPISLSKPDMQSFFELPPRFPATPALGLALVFDLAYSLHGWLAADLGQDKDCSKEASVGWPDRWC